MKKNRSRAGFTLIELVIAMTVMGILAAIAIPAYVQFKKRAKIVLAVGNLSTLQKLEYNYNINNSTYATDLNALEFHADPSDVYSYTVELNPPDDGGTHPFKITAQGNLDGDPDLDTWVIFDNGGPAHTITD